MVAKRSSGKRKTNGRGRDRVNNADEPKPKRKKKSKEPRFPLRAPTTLMARIAKIAAAREESLNETCIALLQTGVAAHQALADHLDELRPLYEREKDYDEPDLPLITQRVLEHLLTDAEKKPGAPTATGSLPIEMPRGGGRS